MSKFSQRKVSVEHVGYQDALAQKPARYRKASQNPNFADYKRGYRRGKKVLETPTIEGYENLDAPTPPISLEEAKANLERMGIQRVITLEEDTTTPTAINEVEVSPTAAPPMSFAARILAMDATTTAEPKLEVDSLGVS
jgi:hypothetical protein